MKRAELHRRLQAAILAKGEVSAEVLAKAADADATDPVVKSVLIKIRDHAYRVNDSDIEALRKANYSEDAIFELMLAAAHGAAAYRRDRAYAVLGGDW